MGVNRSSQKFPTHKQRKNKCHAALIFIILHEPGIDLPLSESTIGCMALLFKLNDQDKYWALENTLFAAIKQAGALDLFNPDTAKIAWEQRRRIVEHPEMAAALAELPEDLTPLHGQPHCNSYAGEYRFLLITHTSIIDIFTKDTVIVINKRG